MSQKKTPELLKPFEAIENAILEGKVEWFKVCLEKCVQASPDQPFISWPDHCLYMVTYSQLSQVPASKQKLMLEALLACAYPPDRHASPNPMSEALRISPRLVPRLVEAGFSLDEDSPTKDNDYLIGQIRQGYTKLAKLLRPGLLEHRQTCQNFLDRLFDINAKKGDGHILDTAKDQGQALSQLLAFPVHPDIQAMAAIAMVHGGRPSCEMMFLDNPGMTEGLVRLVEAKWVSPALVRARFEDPELKKTSNGNIDDFLAELERCELDHNTQGAPVASRKSARL